MRGHHGIKRTASLLISSGLAPPSFLLLYPLPQHWHPILFFSALPCLYARCPPMLAAQEPGQKQTRLADVS